ncbi:MAG: polyprenol monophosphomannose synthase [Actinomycetota bacterium]|nr:polyprenol monophosphomannose synthase [Actinomycetota bacterium]
MLVIVPTFNERASIEEVARLVLAADPAIDLLVVDDSSPDRTAEVVGDLASSCGRRVHLIERPSKQGLGTAYRDGFRWALRRGFGAIVGMDGDLSHDPRVVPRLVESLGHADLVIGSRYVPGGEVRNWGLFRRALSLAGNLYARTALGFGVKDSTSGFRAYRSAWLEAVLPESTTQGYAFQIEMTRRIHRAGGRILEIPIAFTERSAGSSKLSRRIVFEAIWSVGSWALRDRLGRRSSAVWSRPGGRP